LAEDRVATFKRDEWCYSHIRPGVIGRVRFEAAVRTGVKDAHKDNIGEAQHKLVKVPPQRAVKG